MHSIFSPAPLTLRGTTVMLGPENEAMGKRSAKSVGASPAGLYIYLENVDKVVGKATKRFSELSIEFVGERR
jgi:hypothetical protein